MSGLLLLGRLVELTSRVFELHARIGSRACIVGLDPEPLLAAASIRSRCTAARYEAELCDLVADLEELASALGPRFYKAEELRAPGHDPRTWPCSPYYRKESATAARAAGDLEPDPYAGVVRAPGHARKIWDQPAQL